MMSAAASGLRIALCKNSLYGPISGADETLVTYADHLHQAGYDVTVVLLYRPLPGDVFYRRLRKAGVPVVVIAHHSRIYDLLRRVRRLANVIRQTIRPSTATIFVPLARTTILASRNRSRDLGRTIVRRLGLRHLNQCRQHFETARYSVVHIVTPDSGAEIMIRAGADSGTPILYHEMGTPYHMPELDGAYQRLAEVTPLCTRVAALSPILARQWAPYLPHRADIMVQPLIVARPRLWSIPRRINDDAPIVGFAARLQTGKGPQILVEAFVALLRGGQAARLRMAGAGELDTSLKQRIRDADIADHCEFAGTYDTRDGCAAFLRTLDIFVLPSFAEGTPNSIIEAMACGVPIIASDVGGIRDIIAPDAGILVPPGDIIALADAIARLANDPGLRRAMSAAGRSRYEAVYAPEAGLAGLVSTYTAVRDAAEAA